MSIGDPAEMSLDEIHGLVDAGYLDDGERCYDCGELQPYDTLTVNGGVGRCMECASDLGSGATPTAELCDGVTLPLDVSR